jgi:hypothetical protein
MAPAVIQIISWWKSNLDVLYKYANKMAGATKNEHREPSWLHKAKRATDSEQKKICVWNINMKNTIEQIWNKVKTNLLVSAETVLGHNLGITAVVFWRLLAHNTKENPGLLRAFRMTN